MDVMNDTHGKFVRIHDGLPQVKIIVFWTAIYLFVYTGDRTNFHISAVVVKLTKI